MSIARIFVKVYTIWHERSNQPDMMEGNELEINKNNSYHNGNNNDVYTVSYSI